MNDGLTAADVMAMTKDSGSDWMNNPFIYLVWLALLGNGGIGGFGGNAAVQGAITRSDLFDGFNKQDVNDQIRNISNGICDGFYAVNTGMLNGFNNLGARIDSCCCETNRNIDAVRYEGAKNTCDITSAIHAEGEATRALINANTMQELRDRLDARDRDVLARDFQLSQLAQNAYLVDALKSSTTT